MSLSRKQCHLIESLVAFCENTEPCMVAKLHERRSFRRSANWMHMRVYCSKLPQPWETFDGIASM